MGKVLGDFSGNREAVRIFYIEINGNCIFDLRVFTLRTVFIELITFVNDGGCPYVAEFVRVCRIRWQVVVLKVMDDFRVL